MQGRLKNNNLAKQKKKKQSKRDIGRNGKL